MIYHRLVDSGLIKPLAFGRDSRAELELESRLYPDDPSLKEALEQRDISDEDDSEEVEVIDDCDDRSVGDHTSKRKLSESDDEEKNCSDLG